MHMSTILETMTTLNKYGVWYTYNKLRYLGHSRFRSLWSIWVARKTIEHQDPWFGAYKV